MKALFFQGHGELDVLQYGDVSDLEPDSGEILIHVRASALNYLDIWVGRGWPGLNLEMPHWCGADVAGEIAAVGKNVTGWSEGQRVIVDPGVSTMQDRYTREGEDSLSPGYRIIGEHVRGGNAEFFTVSAGNLKAIPEGLDFPEAAAPLLVSLTAWRMMIKRGKLKAGETVLVVGAGGGVNSMAIQIARLAGATVFVVAKDSTKAEKALELGADVVLDRSQVDWGKEIFKRTDKRGVDMVVDNVGSATLNKSMLAAARGGRIVIVGNTSGPKTEIDIRYIFGKQISLIGSTMGSHQDFDDVTDLLVAKKLKPVIDCVMPLKDGREAYKRMAQGEQFGKIVLTP